MVQYYYDKFTVIESYQHKFVYQTEGSNYGMSLGHFTSTDNNFADFTYNGTTKVFAGVSRIVNPSTFPSLVYRVLGGILLRFTLKSISGDTGYYDRHDASPANSTPVYSKGSLVQSNIAAEDGTYPANGKHTDGYWYVKGAVVGPLPPGTVINQPYSTAGNGGRKLVRLNDGTLVACVLGQVATAWFLHVYKSTDNGNSWTFLGKNSSWSLLSTASWALTTNGTSVFVLITVSSAVQFKELRISEMNGGDWALGANDQGKYAQLDDNQSALAGVSLAIDPTNGHLHAAWASKNGVYPYSFNIRYTKSTDGGVTWSAVEQVSNYNQSTDYALTNPTIVVKNGHPLIVAGHSYGSTYKGILAFTTAFTDKAYSNFNAKWGNKVVFSGASYYQSYPSAVVDKDGVIHVVWQGLDATDTVKENIRYSKSIDNGVSWDVIKLTSGNTYSNYQPSISVDKSGKVVVVYSGVDTAISTSRDNIRARYLSGGIWSSAITLTSNTSNNAIYPSVLYDPFFSGNFGTVAPTIYQNAGVSVEYIGTYTTNNAPTVSLSSPSNNQTLYENDTLNISGNAYDSDKDQSVTAYYQINSEPKKVLATNLSQTQIALSKQLTFKGGKLYDGDTALTGTLADGVAHTLKVWAEDSEKASSAIIECTFYVVPNRAPLLSVDAVVPSGVVDADKFKISGTASDQDANSTVKVTRRINAGNAVEIYSGAGGAWEFELALSQLVVGQNTIVIEVIDNYGAKASKTITLNKNELKTPILQSVARYKITPPAGSAKGVLLFIERDEALNLKVELSMTLSGEQEQYETLTASNTAPMPNTNNIVEDTYYHEKTEPKDNIILKLSTTRPDATVNHKIHLISGAVE